MGLLSIFKSKPKQKQKLFMEFAIAGANYHQNEMRRAFPQRPNPKKPQKRPYWKYYLYEIYEGPCQTIPEPNNPYDRNAIRIVVNNQTVGYCPSDQCLALKTIISKPSCAKVTLYGGDYQMWENGAWVRYHGDINGKVLVWEP